MKTDIALKYELLTSQIHDLFEKIQSSESLAFAANYFDNLQRIQEVLSALLFKYEFALPKQLVNFVRECDRLDDPDLRRYMFDKLKNKTFSYDTYS